MISRVNKILYFLLLPIVLIACSKNDSSSNFDPSIFYNNQYSVILGFDLRNDDAPIAGLVINAKSTLTPTLKTLALPFGSTRTTNEKEIYSSTGSYQDTTLVSYYLSSKTNGTYSIGIVPIFPPSPEGYWDPDELKNSIALVVNGLNRIFVYRYPEVDPFRQDWIKDLSYIANTHIELIGISLPKDAKGQEIRGTNRTAIPDFVSENRDTKFYPAKSNAAGEKALEISYQLPSSEENDLFVEYAIKFIIVLISPSLQLLLKPITLPDEKSKRAHQIITFSLIAIQIILTIVILVLSILSWGKSSLEGILNLVIAIISGAVTGYILWRNKPKASQ